MKPLSTFGVTAMLVCCVTFSYAQWTWTGGSNEVYASAVYIEKDDTLATPGGLTGGATWTGQDGKLYLFGGSGHAVHYYMDIDWKGNPVRRSRWLYGVLDDLWRYDPVTRKWTWLKGSQWVNRPGEYGTLGTPAPGNIPRSRFVAVTWTDPSGNLWLFGGNDSVNTPLNDLWRYTISTNTWTWMGGSDTPNQPGTYGTKGIPLATNQPGSRGYSVSWTDHDGKFWLFGGFGKNTTHYNRRLNDLWKYDPVTNMWTWLSGDSSSANYIGVYGIKGVADVSNKPGGRQEATGWTDADGNLWLFGGYGIDRYSQYGNTNELWKYSPATNQWTWVNGNDRVNNPSVYGIKGQPHILNQPGARRSLRSWTDANGNTMLFGGFGYSVYPYSSYWNDAWKYNSNANMWTWIGGYDEPDYPGEYGIIGTPDPNNIPGARSEYMTWQLGNTLYLFGGFGYDQWGSREFLNDVWQFDLSASVARHPGIITKALSLPNDHANVNIAVYPNPVTNKLFIKLPPTVNKGTAILYNTQGVRLLSQPLQQNSTLSVNSIPKGAYYLKIIYNNNTLTRTIIVK